ncbi:MAG TPA: amidohydrolase family protein [Pseudobacteroides sp.]|uniref:amidohydrolase family protein n=1 Tax=Pseudobacteroides sp. TaxID=1968840 RepID=UPI002F936962
MDRNEFTCYLQSQPIVNSHSHHLPDKDQYSLALEAVLRNSYVNWCGTPIPSANSKEDIATWLDAVRTRSYFVWLEKAIMDLYGIEEHLDVESWITYDKAIRCSHQNKDWHIRLLREKCAYKAIVLDTFWSPGEDNGHPDLFKPAYRINSFFYGYNQTAKDHNGNNIQVMYNRDITDIDEYTDFIYQVIRDKKQAESVALKCALAYDRTLAFGETGKEQAQRAMVKDADAVDIKYFQDYVFDCVCKTAAELNIPIQIHTGLGLMTGSNAMQLQPLIARNPRTAFLLMHGSYPWISDITGLAHAYSNVWADLCWLPLISPAAAHRLLHELIDVCDANRVIWGCDTWTSEESYGARLAFLNVLSRVLCERVEAGLMREHDARRYAKAIMHDNAARVFGI